MLLLLLHHTGLASHTFQFMSPAGSKAYDREMSSHAYGPIDCSTFTQSISILLCAQKLTRELANLVCYM